MKTQLILLVGPPLSGKDTYIRTIGFSNYQIISRDDIMMSLHENNDYSQAFYSVDQKKVDTILQSQIELAKSEGKNVIINMTNLSKKSRYRHLSKFDSEKYEKTAIVFPRLDLAEYGIRNNKRKTEENKSIPLSVMKSMLDSWQEVTMDEGFDKIINL